MNTCKYVKTKTFLRQRLLNVFNKDVRYGETFESFCEDIAADGDGMKWDIRCPDT